MGCQDLGYFNPNLKLKISLAKYNLILVLTLNFNICSGTFKFSLAYTKLYQDD